jgi:hypothetical protein
MTNMKDQSKEPGLGDPCTPESSPENSKNIDPVEIECGQSVGVPSQKHVANNPPEAWKTPPTKKKLGIGQQANCDPLMTGQIINDLETPNREVIYRYSKALRGCDEAMLDLFRNIIVLDEDGKAHIVPIIWGTQEKAVAALLQDNVRKDNSLVVDRIRLPMMSIISSGTNMDLQRFTYQKAQSYLSWLNPYLGYGFSTQEKFEKDTVFGVTRGIPVNVSYTLYIWTLYQEDMNQILEQVWSKFSPVAYIRVRGVYWEIIVTLDGQANNLDTEPGDVKLRVFKYQLTMTVKGYIPQPITRYKFEWEEETPGNPTTGEEVLTEQFAMNVQKILDKLKDAL